MTYGKSTDAPAGPISTLVRVSTIPKAGIPITIKANVEQRASLAEFHNLVDVLSFEATMQAETWQLDGIRLTGQVRASIVQECVVTLEPVDAEIDQYIDLALVPDEEPQHKQPVIASEVVIETDGPDEPDVFSGDYVDAGAIAEEFFALAIDPYPRREGANIEVTAPEDPGDELPSPFAKLAELKRPN